MTSASNHALALTRLEVWTYRLALGLMAIFTLLSLYVLYFPSDALIAAYVVMLWATLASGLACGVVTIYA